MEKVIEKFDEKFDDEVIQEYRMYVLKSGKVILKEVKADSLSLPELVKDTSVRMAQIISLLICIENVVSREIKDGSTTPDFKKIYLDGVKEMSELFGVSRSTLRDKTERKTGVNTDTIVKLIEDYFMGKNRDLEDVLIRSINPNRPNAPQDLRALKEFFLRQHF